MNVSKTCTTNCIIWLLINPFASLDAAVLVSSLESNIVQPVNLLHLERSSYLWLLLVLLVLYPECKFLWKSENRQHNLQKTILLRNGVWLKFQGLRDKTVSEPIMSTRVGSIMRYRHLKARQATNQEDISRYARRHWDRQPGQGTGEENCVSLRKSRF